VRRGAVKARAYFAKFPKVAYMTEIESWREPSGGRIEFTIRRLPSADCLSAENSRGWPRGRRSGAAMSPVPSGARVFYE
jgi:hypothetical protein